MPVFFNKIIKNITHLLNTIFENKCFCYRYIEIFKEFKIYFSEYIIVYFLHQSLYSMLVEIIHITTYLICFPTGFSFCFFPGFLAIFSFLSSNDNNRPSLCINISYARPARLPSRFRFFFSGQPTEAMWKTESTGMSVNFHFILHIKISAN